MDNFNGYSWEDSGEDIQDPISSRFKNSMSFWSVYNGMVTHPQISPLAIQFYNLGSKSTQLLQVNNEYLFTAHLKGLIDGIKQARPELN